MSEQKKKQKTSLKKKKIAVEKDVPQNFDEKIEIITSETQLKNSKIKEKKIRLSKKFYLIMTLCVVFVTVVLSLAIFILNKIEEDRQLIIPSENIVSVVHFADEYYLNVPESQEAEFYIFEIAKDDETPFEIFCTDNQIDVSAYFGQRATFSIRYYIQKQSNASRSLPSSMTSYTSMSKLSSPILSFDEQTNLLSWDYVANASSYEFFYADDIGIESVIYTPISDINDEGRGTYQLSLPYGIYNVCVVALTQDNYYEKSEASNFVTIEVFDKQNEVYFVLYNLTLQKIFINAQNIEQENHNFAVYIGEEILYFNPSVKSDEYEINILEHNLEITLGITIGVVTLGDGEFLLDSDLAIALPQS